MKLGVLSGYYPGRRFNSFINHASYCDVHGYYYIDATQPGKDRRPFFRKIETIERYLDLFDWIFWIDDDAYFTDFSKPLINFLDQLNGEHMLICKSPSTKKLFTKISSGQFFLRNSEESRAFLTAAKAVDLQFVRDHYWQEHHGYFSQGDQDAFVYLTETHPVFSNNFMRIVDHNQFNNRDFEFASRLDEHFLVHFTGLERIRSYQEFYTRLGVNAALTPSDILAQWNLR